MHATFCSSCGDQLASQSRACPRCGAPRTQLGVPPSPPASAPGQPPRDAQACPEDVRRLVQRFDVSNHELATGRAVTRASVGLLEPQVRHDFIDPFFEALGWDVHNRRSEHREVIVEYDVAPGSRERVDYCFRIERQPMFFVEAKAPRESLDDYFEQALGYSELGQMPVVILTSFREFRAYARRAQPSRTRSGRESLIEIGRTTYRDYERHWPQLAGAFSHAAVRQGAISALLQRVEQSSGNFDLFTEAPLVREAAASRSLEAYSGGGAHVAVRQSDRPSERSFSRDQLLERLCKLLPAQQEMIIEKLRMPFQYLSGEKAAPAIRMRELLQWAEQEPLRVDELQQRYLEITRPASAQRPSAPAVAEARALPPEPVYENAEVRALAERLESAYQRRQRLGAAGEATAAVDGEILDLKRKLREGGQLREGDTLGDDGRYLLRKEIGHGGFGWVWRARDGEGEVAIKVLYPSAARDESRRERFFRGARIMASLHHEGVVRVLQEHGVDGGFHYFVMELVDGPDLQRAVLEKQIASDGVVPVILRVGEALAEAHRKGIVHRDVKPANVLLDGKGMPKLTDFDLVAAADTTGGTRTGALGTFLFSAPEQLHDAKTADARADVYSLGMTAVYCLCGGTLPQIAQQQPQAAIATLDCEEAVKTVLRRAVAWEKEERYSDAGAFCAALGEAVGAVGREEGPTRTKLGIESHPESASTYPGMEAAIARIVKSSAFRSNMGVAHPFVYCAAGTLLGFIPGMPILTEFCDWIGVTREWGMAGWILGGASGAALGMWRRARRARQESEWIDNEAARHGLERYEYYSLFRATEFDVTNGTDVFVRVEFDRNGRQPRLDKLTDILRGISDDAVVKQVNPCTFHVTLPGLKDRADVHTWMKRFLEEAAGYFEGRRPVRIRVWHEELKDT